MSAQRLALEHEDGSKLARADAAGRVLVALGTLLAGEMQDVNRLAGGAISGYTSVAASAGQTVKAGVGVLYGIKVITVGTSPTIEVWDNTTGSGTKLMSIPTAQITANAWLDFGGVGVKFVNGCHIVLTGAGALVNVVAA